LRLPNARGVEDVGEHFQFAVDIGDMEPYLDPELPAVDEDVVCAVGMWIDEHMQNMEGEDIGFEGWADIFDNAVASQSAAEAKAFKTFECGDGSGTMTIEEHTVLDFAVLDPAAFGSGTTDWGSWTITGTGDYESLTGGGNVMTVWDEMQFHFIGEVEV